MVVPFAVDKDRADKEFKDWASSRWFAPNALKKVVKTDSMTGSYLPHWGFDDKTTTDYQGERYLVAMLGQKTNWVRNLRAGDGRAVLQRREREDVSLVEDLSDKRPASSTISSSSGSASERAITGIKRAATVSSAR